VRRATLYLIVLTMSVGCQQPVTRLNAPPHGTTECPSRMQDMYVSMQDNGLLADMSISDVHFVPQRTMLNSLGEERLARLAGLLEAYGGTIRLSTNETDDKLRVGRMAAVREFLCAVGIDTTAEVLTLDSPAGRGMPASEAILIKAHEATYRPKKSDGAPGASPPSK